MDKAKNTKYTDQFKKTILSYLENRASTDQLFAVTYAKESKNIDDCITYILNTVEESGASGFTDEEVYSMAIHYYDEDNIEVGSDSIKNMHVVVNHQVQLTAEEIEQAKKEAKDKIFNDAYNDMKKKPKPTIAPVVVEKSNTNIQESLF